MDFGSIPFMIWFLPCFLVVYYLQTSDARRKVWIITGSLLFYGVSFGAWLIPLLGLAVGAVLAYVAVREKGKAALIVGTIIFTGILVYAKVSGQLMPGISFLIFTILSLLIDTYRNPKRKYAPANILSYVLCFPKLLSGPIARIQELPLRYDPVVYTNRKAVILERLENGSRTFIIGLGYKVLLANQLAGLWRDVQTIGIPSISTPLAWIGLLGYSLQLYFDFHGYSLMAVGIGQMLGFSLPQNFHLPYLSKSVSEFYRRWHMTLGNWFRDYIYVPLGGSRKGMARTIGNLLLVWMLTGLWHGFGWNFFLWGIFLFFFIALEKLFLKRFLTGIFGHIYVCLLIPLSWVFFALENLADIKWYFLRLFAPILGNTGVNVAGGDYLKYGSIYLPFLLLGLLFAFVSPEDWLTKHGHKWFTAVILTVVFWLAVYHLSIGVQNPFMYFSF